MTTIYILDQRTSVLRAKLVFKKAVCLVLLGLGLTSCKKFTEVPAPSTFTNAAIVFSDDATATAVLTGVYQKISYAPFTAGVTSLSLFPELSSDNLLSTASDPQFLGYYHNNLDVYYTGNSSNFWNDLYPVIYTANSAIEGINSSTTLSATVKQQLLGESYFIRAFCYFYLTNLIGDVPLALTSDYAQTSVLPRSSSEKIYEQIISDLKNAQQLLSETYVDNTLTHQSPERTRPNKYAATALLSRVYLYTKDYTDAEQQASAVIGNSNYAIASLDQVFKKNSSETIWALYPVTAGENTKAARFYVLPETGPNESAQPTYLSLSLMQAFENNDQRKIQWVSTVTANGVDYPYSAKYKEIIQDAPVTEYQIVLRLSELFLIRAEARAQQGKLPDAKDDLNQIRNRAGLVNTSANAKDDLINAIYRERRVELFTEWGDRWLDLKRTGRVDEAMKVATLLKGGTWNINWQLYPVPQTEIDKNRKLTQNTGY
ncbi:RagB/SusD family nutrient uptake outer membrane protein [Chitinophaga sp. Ak27]|uniref:RagB/SusD family nutrient uptake outer membrane protein n=1 Tax=Chitinophaga sp. Ak27 TaxID=2726116 RepID=UPI00145C6D95|nr:RagB/SusD family nutrient uptake outer membrane protein [Chitinophaga sp. Ak27]NLU94875.1 RagB/SusD family nutrient uptake outer membrane protein [Chitinophaga sp. Ak27]